MSDLSDAVREARARWTTDTGDAAAWDANALVGQLRKSRRPAESVSFAEEAIGHWPQFDPLRGALAWALYSRDIAPLEAENATGPQHDAAKVAIDRIQELTGNDPYAKFSAWPQAVLRLAKVVQGRRPNVALDLLGKLDYEMLDTELSVDFPSKAARWHLGVTKALKDLEQWEKLLDSCDLALDANGLRAEDVTWIRFRRAFALEHCGRVDEAVNIFFDLRTTLPKWWLEADLARVLAAVHRYDDAIAACQRALTQPGDLPSRWRTVFLLAQLLESNDSEAANAHYRLARYLRFKSGWPLDADLEARAGMAGITEQPPSTFDLAPLRCAWSDAPDPSRSLGTIKRLLGDGHSGFIVPDSPGIDLYFAMPRASTNTAPPIDTRVSFRVVAGFDKKKNQPSQNAVDVRPLSPPAT